MGAAEEIKRKEEEDKVREALYQEANQNEPIISQNVDLDPYGTTSETLTGGHVHFEKLGLTSFTLSKHHTMDFLDTNIFNKNRNTIMRRLEKILKMGTYSDAVTVMENEIM